MNSTIFDWIWVFFFVMLFVLFLAVLFAGSVFAMNTIYGVGQVLAPGDIGLLISLWIFLAWTKSDKSDCGAEAG